MQTVFLQPARSTNDSIAITQGPKIRFIALQGRPVVRILVHSSMPCQILPKLVHGWGRKPPKLKILQNFGI